MYDNTYSADKDKVIFWAKRNASAGVRTMARRIKEIKADLLKAENLLKSEKMIFQRFTDRFNMDVTVDKIKKINTRKDRLPKDTPKEKILSELKDKGLYYWNENLKLVNSLNDLKLPLPIKTKNKRLKEYCKLRIQTYELIYKAIEEDTGKYDEQISNLNQKIDAIIKELSAK
jgi:Mg2+ and Co2+ transporter CorA